jgi:hypothetical protein
MTGWKRREFYKNMQLEDTGVQYRPGFAPVKCSIVLCARFERRTSVQIRTTKLKIPEK